MEIKELFTDVDNSLPLFIQGETPQGWGEDVSREGGGGGGIAFDALPPFLAYSDDLSSVLNLIISGKGLSISSGLDLTIFNEQFVRALNLFIQGLGSTTGARPYEAELNLFLQRDEFSEIMTLFLSGYDAVLNRDLSCFINGILSADANIDLSIPKVSAEVINNMTLYIHGV